MRVITCREHNGTFEIESARGRPPVKCGQQTSGKNYGPCTKAPKARKGRQATPAQIAKAADRAMNQPRATRIASSIKNRAQTVTEPVETNNPSLTKAQAAKAMLEPLGWSVQGRAWTDDSDYRRASILAQRNTETIAITWLEGNVLSSEYVLWDHDVPVNDMPATKLPFDPDETSDKELVRLLSGMKVTWWNKLGQSTEAAVIGDRVTIEHAYNERGESLPSQRMIKFVDKSGGGYRAFYLAQLIKVG